MIDRDYVSKEAALAMLDSVRTFGTGYFLRELSENTGLLGILHKALPEVWEKVFCLACYLMTTNKPVMYCEDWVSSNAGFNAGSMASQRISELLMAFGSEQRNHFYELWYSFIREREYIAPDMTSESSYSENIAAVKWGYNRDGEKLPQANICMLFGDDSRLPVYQTIYSGSLRDVSTLKGTISEFSALTGGNDIMITTNKVFFSAKNVDMLLSKTKGKAPYRFLKAVPFTSKFAKDLVESERKDIDNYHNTIRTSGTPIRGICKLRTWGGSVKLNAHVFFDPEKATKAKNELFQKVMDLEQEAIKGCSHKIESHQ